LSGEKPREIAARILGQLAANRWVEEVLEQTLAGNPLPPADRRLCQELAYGVVRWQATLDWLIARKTGGRTQKRGLQDLLRLGLYQVFWLERIPSHAAVFETVEQAKQRGFGPQSGFVNAVMRSYLREFEPTRRLLDELQRTAPHIGYSHPEWLVHRWQQRWGPERTAQVMAWNNKTPDTFARVNTLKTEPEKLVEQWRQEDVEYDFVRRDWLEENLVFVLKSHPPLGRLPSFQQGSFYVQDPSTLLSVFELDPGPGETVLDLCAAPGGKLTFIAQRMRNEGRIIAHDPVAERLHLVEENCVRLGVSCVKTVSSWAGTEAIFDKVLVDAPCSNTGVMRRRVDLRWRIRPEEIERLRRTQSALLGQAARLLRRGGVLVYSTCSLEPEENEAVVGDFLRDSPEFRLERARELHPATDCVDGAYVARLRLAPQGGASVPSPSSNPQ
jgi:16S rRNA (cytosine967-C5)-methyltransferase